VPLSVGILIIGSLHWDEDRDAWRESRLCMRDACDVRAPIRYGRMSENRGNTYTMVFSRSCPPGQAKAVPCNEEIETPNDLFEEAEYLWAAECLTQRDGTISRPWGCVTVLFNPDRDIPRDISEGWARRVALAKPYGNILQTDAEGELMSRQGLLRIEWPRLVHDDSPLPLDTLLATATQPTLTGTPRNYPTVEMIANAWRHDQADNVKYFRNNVRDGIRTFEDNAIAAALDAPA